MQTSRRSTIYMWLELMYPPAGDVSSLDSTGVFVIGALKRDRFTELTHAFAMTGVAVHTHSKVQELMSVRS